MTTKNSEKEEARELQRERGWSYSRALAWVREGRRSDARCLCGETRATHEARQACPSFIYNGTHRRCTQGEAVR